jgi:phosphate:Na+ symporter
MNVFLLIIAIGLSSSNIRLVKVRDPLGRDICGDEQVGVIGRELKHPIIIEAVDSTGRPLENIWIGFRVVAEPRHNIISGKKTEVFPDSILTDSRGYAKFRVKIGGTTGNYYLEAYSPETEKKLKFSFTILKPHWQVFLFFGLIGGLALFMYGLNFGSKALTRLAGSKLKEALWRLTRNPVLGIFIGIIMTIVTQSSSATTVMLVSLSNAGLMVLAETLGVILGADIGTTLTVQLISFKIFDYAILIIALGFFIMTFVKKRNMHYIGRLIFAFGLVFFGMRVMSNSVHPLTFMPGIQATFMKLGNRPLLALLISVVFTGIIRSSGTTIALVLSFAFQGLITIEAAIPLIFGANIGTCVTALLACIGRSREARKVAMAHIFFKIIGVAIFFPFIPHFANLISYTAGSLPRQIANAHTIFNCAAAIIFLPLLPLYAKLVGFLTPAGAGGEKFKPIYLDTSMLSSPGLAIGQASREVLRMADIVQNMLSRSLDVFKTNDSLLRKKLIENDNKVDTLEEKITSYLTKLSEEELTPDLSKRAVTLLYVTDELEHIGDVVSKSLMVYAKKKLDQGFYFSKEGFKEIQEFYGFTLETLRMSIDALATFNKSLAKRVSERMGEGDKILLKLHNAHLDRLRKGLKESMETSTVHLDLISDLERINFHAGSIGEHILGKL